MDFYKVHLFLYYILSTKNIDNNSNELFSLYLKGIDLLKILWYNTRTLNFGGDLL